MIKIDNMYLKGFKMSYKSYRALQNEIIASSSDIEINF